MGFDNIPLLSGLQARMRFAQEKLRVVSENIAHANTPEYRAREIVEPNFDAVLSAVNKNTGASHIASPRVSMPQAFLALGSQVASEANTIKPKKGAEIQPSGNNVSLEEQVSTLSDVQLEYSELTTLYKRQMDLLRVALGKNR